MLLLNVGSIKTKINSATLPIAWPPPLSDDAGESPTFSARAVADTVANNKVAMMGFDNAFIFFRFWFKNNKMNSCWLYNANTMPINQKGDEGV